MSTPPPVVPAAPTPSLTPARTLARARRVGARERLALIAIALWIPCQLLAAWPAPLVTALDGPWRYDPAIFAYEGALVRAGAMPYVAFWDHKGPLIYVINAAGLSLSDGALWGVWVAGLVAIGAAAAAGYRTMRDAFGVPGALVGLVFFVFALAGIDTSANMTEQYAQPLAWASALALVTWARTRRGTFTTGFVLGALGTLAFFLRANLAGAAATAVLTMTVVLLHERRSGTLGRAAAGAALGTLAAGVPLVAWLADGDALRGFWEQAIRYNLLYAQTDWTQRVVAAIAGVWFATMSAPLLLPIAGLILCARRLRRTSTNDRSYALLLFVVGWPVVELLLASVSGRTYDHYFMMLIPPMALLTAALVAEGLPLLPVNIRRRVSAPAIVATLFIVVMLRPLSDRIVTRARTTGFLPSRASSQVALTADFVRANSAADDRLLVWGLAGGVYFLADRPPASRYLFAFPLLTRGYGDSIAPEFLAALERTPPALIVDAAVSDPSSPSLAGWNPAWQYPNTQWQAPYRTMTPALRPFYDFVARNYTALGVVGPERWVVYRANSLVAHRAQP